MTFNQTEQELRDAAYFGDEEAKEILARPNALMSLWGSGDVERDRKRRNTAKSMIAPGSRPQEIYTPQSILDVVAAVWSEGIALDPCSGPDSIVKAEEKLDGSEGRDGLVAPWFNRTYCNPPFKTLKLWLAKAEAEAAPKKEIIVLCPVRPHRVWFRRMMRNVDAISFLDPLCFQGYKQAFPAPLCLLYWGKHIERFYEACKQVSKP